MAFDMEEQFSEECVDSGIHEECGVFGAYDFDGNDIASTVYYGLFALQHRGQESCGIAVSDTHGPKGKVTTHKGMGLVNVVLQFLIPTVLRRTFRFIKEWALSTKCLAVKTLRN